MNTLGALMGVAAGSALGLLFYGGLWWTIRRLSTARSPAALALASFWIRAAGVAGAATWFVRRGWIACAGLLAGFALGRIVVSGLVRGGRAAVKCT